MEIAIHSRRQIISGLMLALFSGLVPLGANSAIARNGGRGGGSGGRGSDGGGNRGNSGRDGGSGGGQGNRGSNNSGRNSNSSAETRTNQGGRQRDTVSIDKGNISVRHGSGIAEEVNDRGRYVMRDRSGRTIVNRAARKSDLERLRSLIK